MILRLNPEITAHPLETGSNEPFAVIELPAGPDRSSRYAVPLKFVELLKLFEEPADRDQAIADYLRSNPERCSEEQAQKLINEYFIPKRFLMNEEEEIEPGSVENAPALKEQTAKRRQSQLYLKYRLFSSRAVYPVARSLGWLFKPAVISFCVPLFLISHLLVYLSVLPSHPLRLDRLTGGELLLVILITAVAGLAHELGHAVASTVYGGRQAEIGCGLYLFYPVFYTDVSESWKLSRRRRAVVDVAGIYFHCICLVLLLVVFALTGSPAAVVCFVLIDLQIITTLNPFLRMDGYWVVSDLLGVFNLRKLSTELLKHYVTKILGIKGRHDFRRWKLSPLRTVLLGGYGLLSIAFFVFLFEMVIRHLIFGFLPTYPSLFRNLYVMATESPIQLSKVLASLFTLLVRTLVFAGILRLLYGLLPAGWNMARSALAFIIERYRSAALSRSAARSKA